MDTDLVDCDNHYYETDDFCSRYIEPAFADRAVRIVRDPGEPLGRMLIGDEPHHFLTHFAAELVAPPGEPEGYVAEPGRLPDFNDRAQRLVRMDELGIRSAVVYPSIGLSWQPQLRSEPDALYANIRAFNRWIDDEWGYARDARITGVPVLTLVDRDLAVAELDRVLAAGARIVAVMPGTVLSEDGRSPGDPHFDPIWARLAEAEVPVAVHVCNSGYAQAFTEFPGRPVTHHTMSPYQRYRWAHDVNDFLAGMLLHNAFARHPKLSVLSVENGAGWVGRLLTLLDAVASEHAGGDQLGGPLAERPSETFRRHVYVSPFGAVDDLPGLISLIGADRVLAGTDYPHDDDSIPPADYAALLADLPAEDQDAILRRNTSTLLKLG